ncbi:unnamed protein product, partial [Schistosoma mattheei]
PFKAGERTSFGETNAVAVQFKKFTSVVKFVSEHNLFDPVIDCLDELSSFISWNLPKIDRFLVGVALVGCELDRRRLSVVLTLQNSNDRLTAIKHNTTPNTRISSTL